MMQQISSEEDEKVNHTQMLMHCYGDSMEANRKLLSSVESSMEELDMAAFVQVSHTCAGETGFSRKTVTIKKGFFQSII